MASIQEEDVLGKAYDSRLMKRLLGYLRPYRAQVLVALVAIILKASVDVLGPYLTKVAIDKYLANRTISHSWLDRYLSSQPMTGIAQIAGIYLGLLLTSFLFEFTQTYIMQWAGQKVMFDLRAEIFRHLQRLHVSFFDRNPVGRLVTRVTSDVDALNEMFTAGVVSIFEDIFVLIGIVAIMLNMSWRLALITFAVLPIIAYATSLFRKAVRESYRRIRIAIARINAYLQEHVSGIVVLQLFNREKRSYEQFEKINRTHMDAFKDAILAHAIYYPVVEVLSATAIACVVWFGGNQVIRNTVSLGVLVAFMQYAQRFFRPIQDLSEKYNILQSAMASSERVFKLLDTKVEIVSPVKPQAPEGPGRIEFDHVWFAYRTLAQAAEEAATKGEKVTAVAGHEYDWVLRDVSFTIGPSETVAFVGHTGAGKTTIISLLLRFYDVQRGAIRVDGVDIREMDLAELRRRYGVVLQDPFLFSGTVADNIRLGTHWISDSSIEDAAEQVNVADFIRSLPGGFAEEVRERGSTLSTGQKQLISFARALAHNPKILILDEATSSVDTETEFRVRDALTRMVEGRTSIMIAHRLSTVQRANKIVVMHKGKVREIGSHQQLLTNKGIYWKLYQLQYKDQEIPASALGGELAQSTVGVSADD
ncbi:MAG TPA: ABC transporter ATP-binding protein [Candidatus Angelobacter sp.]|nr:ABC transporter ATP-binding protein [Candidatus Angelobacter sp.]